MKYITRLKTLAGSALVAFTLLIGASMTPASAQVVVAPVQYYSGPGCPVAPYNLQNVLSGMYGVDGYSRPVNQFGFPVDIYGNCLTPAPVVEIFNYQPGPGYISFLFSRYGYSYRYNPLFVHLYFGPGVLIHRSYGAIPAGRRVIIQQNYRSTVPVHPMRSVGPTTTVAPGATRTVRPGGTPTGTGPSQTVRPGVNVSGAPAAVKPPSAVTPPRAAAPTSTFNRPTAAAPQGSVTPPRAAAPTRTFNRPSAPSSSHHR
jgi:hypothetical protein